MITDKKKSNNDVKCYIDTDHSDNTNRKLKFHSASPRKKVSNNDNSSNKNTSMTDIDAAEPIKNFVIPSSPTKRNGLNNGFFLSCCTANKEDDELNFEKGKLNFIAHNKFI